MHRPEKRVLVAVSHPALKRASHPFGQRFDRTVRVDAVDVVELEPAFVARFHQRSDPLEYQGAEEAGLVLRAYFSFLRHRGYLAPS